MAIVSKINVSGDFIQTREAGIEVVEDAAAEISKRVKEAEALGFRVRSYEVKLTKTDA